MKITKKVFKELSDIHTYGHGSAAMRVLYFDRQSGYTKDEKFFAGYKYAIAEQFITSAQLLNLAYDRIVLNKFWSHSSWSGHRVAVVDTKRFKVSLAFNDDVFVYDQSAYDKTKYHKVENNTPEHVRNGSFLF